MTPATDPPPPAPLAGETLLSITDVCRRYPGRDGGGKRLHYTTVLRWINGGTRNPHTGEVVKLEAIRAGGRRLTSVEALARYHERLARREPTPSPNGRKQASRRQKAVNAELDRLGL